MSTPQGGNPYEFQSESEFYEVVKPKDGGTPGAIAKTGMEAQFKAHVPTVATRPELGLNEFGAPEGAFLYSKNGDDWQYHCDLTVKKVEVQAGEPAPKRGWLWEHQAYVVPMSINILCPSCGSPCFMSDRDHSGGEWTIHIHWDRMIQGFKDRKLRPAVTVEEAFRCDYSWKEVNGIMQPSHQVLNRCNFRGRLELGRMHHDQSSSIVLTR